MSDPTPKNRNPNKIVIALQFWEGDKVKAMHLARLLADLEPVKNEKVDLAFVARFDATHDQETIDYVSRKFDVWTLKGTRRGEGWPHGCNELALDLLHQAANRSRPRQSWDRHKAMYMIESDVIPACRNWLARLSDEWDFAQENGAMVMGAWCPFHAPMGHINGNMFVQPDLMLKIPGVIGCPANAGWDAFFAPKFSVAWHKSVLMQNHYDYRSNIPPEILFSCVDGVTPPAVIHGVKDFSAEMQLRPILFP